MTTDPLSLRGGESLDLVVGRAGRDAARTAADDLTEEARTLSYTDATAHPTGCSEKCCADPWDLT